MFRLALSSHRDFSFQDTNRDTLSPCATSVSESKCSSITERDIVNGFFCNLCAFALRLALKVFCDSADES